MAIPFSELNKINPSSRIILFEMELTVGIHVPNPNTQNLETVFRFHNGCNLNLNTEIKFANQSYQRVPVKADGFEQNGQGIQKRPALTFSNLGGIVKDGEVRNMSDFLALVNAVTPNNDLIGAKITRRQVLASSLDHSNFVGNNPFGTPSDPPDQLRTQIFTIDRKAQENREVVVFECTTTLDMQNLLIPRRVVTRDLFPAVGNFA